MAQQQLKYIIVDDSYYTSLSIRDTISELRPMFVLAGIAEETSEAKSLLMAQDVDFIVAKESVSGRNVISELHDLLKNIPIIVVSQTYRNRDKIKCGNVIDFLLEPVSPVDLGGALSRL